MVIRTGSLVYKTHQDPKFKCIAMNVNVNTNAGENTLVYFVELV